MSHEQLAQTAIGQYQRLFASLQPISGHGALALPVSVGAYLMNPARAQVRQTYADLYRSGHRFTSDQPTTIVAITAINSGEMPSGTVAAVQTCEVANSPAEVTYRRAYFKIDPADGALKVFILNTQLVSSCPVV